MAYRKGLQSLKAFLDSVTTEKYPAIAARAESKVAHEDALEEMRGHILKLYEKTEAPNSFMDETGAIFDCIPIEQQPALRGSKESVPKAPDAPPIEPAGLQTKEGPHQEWKDHLVKSPIGADQKDRHGNLMFCPDGTIPMRRVTLDELTRFPH